MRYRIIKPDWGKALITVNNEQVENPKLVREIKGHNTYEGYFKPEFVKAKNEAGYNIYYFPNETSKKVPGYLTGRDVDLFHYLFVDMDLKDGKYSSKEAFIERVADFPLEPSKIVFSGNGVHVYWKIRDLDGDAFKFSCFQKQLIKLFDTDTSIWTPLQLMRVPNTYNTKDPNNFKLVEEVFNEPNEYSKLDFFKVLGEPSEAIKKEVQEHIDKLNGVVSIDMKDSLEGDIPEKFLKLIDKQKYPRELFLNPKGVMGDRSSADMALANYLIAKADFSKPETLQVLMNTEKALQRQGRSRYDYALNTVEKACRDKTPMSAFSAQSLMESADLQDLGAEVNGPYYLDCLHKRWRKKQMLGLVAGSGVGKTAQTLKIFKEFIKNNPENDDIYFFFNLEMTGGEILERWKKLVGSMPGAYSRLFVIGRDFFETIAEDAVPNIQTIYRIVRDTCKRVGKEAGSVCIDHIDALEGDFDMRIEPHFNAAKSKYVERFLDRERNIVVLNKDGICQKLKTLAQELNTFLIVQSQTTKGKDDGGDRAIGKNDAFGTSKFEWFCDMIVGIWQPLNQAMDHCKKHNLYVTAYQYAKIREKNPEKDRILENEPRLLKFIPENADFVGMSDQDMEKFDEILSTAITIKEMKKENKSKKYFKAPMSPRARLKSGLDKSVLDPLKGTPYEAPEAKELPTSLDLSELEDTET